MIVQKPALGSSSGPSFGKRKTTSGKTAGYAPFFQGSRRRADESGLGLQARFQLIDKAEGANPIAERQPTNEKTEQNHEDHAKGRGTNGKQCRENKYKQKKCANEQGSPGITRPFIRKGQQPIA